MPTAPTPPAPRRGTPSVLSARCMRASLAFWFLLLPALYIQLETDRWNWPKDRAARRQAAINSAGVLVVSGLSLRGRGRDVREGAGWDEDRAAHDVAGVGVDDGVVGSGVGKAAGGIALCIAGHLRSFHQESVHGSIRKHVIDVLRSTGATVDVFFHIGEDDIPKPGTSRANYDAQAINETIHSFKPVSVSYFREETEIEKGQATAHCNATRASLKQYPYALLRNEQCLDQISRFEQQRGAQYAWIYKTRPDIAFGNPVTTPVALAGDTLYMNQHNPGTSTHAHDWLRKKFPQNAALLSGPVGDHVLSASRSTAQVAFRSLRALHDCALYELPNGTLNSEVALTYWLVRNNVKWQALPWFWMLVRDQEGPECTRVQWIRNARHWHDPSLTERCLRYKQSGHIPMHASVVAEPAIKD